MRGPAYACFTPGNSRRSCSQVGLPGVPGVNRTFYATELGTSACTPVPTFAHFPHVPE
jgi:hypothetical protein